MRRLIPMLRYAAVAALFLIAAEFGLRAAGLFDPTELADPYLGFPGTAPLYRAETAADGTALRRTSPNKRRAYRDVGFPVAKENDELRVFCIGGSSLHLERFSSPAAAFPDFLELLLAAAAPDRRVRVINAGGGATGSVQNLEVLREVLEYQPDLLLVYPEGGEKNLVPPAPAGLLALRDEHSPARVRARVCLARLHLYAAARESLARLRPTEKSSRLRSAFSAIAASVYSGAFQPDSFSRMFELKKDRPPLLMKQVIPAHEIERGQARFRRNLERMCDLARERGVPLVFVVPQRNVESSFYTRFHIDPSEIRPGEEQRWRRLYDDGLAAKRQGRFEEAIVALQGVRSTYVEDRDDILAFYLGQCHAALGREREALREYALSVQRHPLRGILLRVAAERGVAVVDPFEALVAEAGGGAPGHTLFVDSMHPMPAAGLAIAHSILERLLEEPVIEGLRAPDAARAQELQTRCRSLARESTERNSPLAWHIQQAIAAGDPQGAAQLGDRVPRSRLIGEPVDLFYYGWALTLANRLDDARALFEESRAVYIQGDTRLPTLDTPEQLIAVAFAGDVFAWL